MQTKKAEKTNEIKWKWRIQWWKRQSLAGLKWETRIAKKVTLNLRQVKRVHTSTHIRARTCSAFCSTSRCIYHTLKINIRSAFHMARPLPPWVRRTVKRRRSARFACRASPPVLEGSRFAADFAGRNSTSAQRNTTPRRTAPSQSINKQLETQRNCLQLKRIFHWLLPLRAWHVTSSRAVAGAAALATD